MCLTSLTVLASMSWATTGIKLGLIMCIMTLGVHIAYRILDIKETGLVDREVTYNEYLGLE